jgi:hypothetical protein
MRHLQLAGRLKVRHNVGVVNVGVARNQQAELGSAGSGAIPLDDTVSVMAIYRQLPATMAGPPAR